MPKKVSLSILRNYWHQAGSTSVRDANHEAFSSITTYTTKCPLLGYWSPLRFLRLVYMVGSISTVLLGPQITIGLLTRFSAITSRIYMFQSITTDSEKSNSHLLNAMLVRFLLQQYINKMTCLKDNFVPSNHVSRHTEWFLWNHYGCNASDREQYLMAIP